MHYPIPIFTPSLPLTMTLTLTLTLTPTYPNPSPDPKPNPNSVGLANLFEFGLENGKIALR